jgi:hypothetical protein
MYSIPWRERWLGRRILGSARYDLPLALGAFGTWIPHRVQQTFIVLPPIAAVGDSNSPADVERIRSATYEAIDSRLRLVRQAPTP